MMDKGAADNKIDAVEALFKVHVNIFDLVDGLNKGAKRVRVHRSVADLATYSMDQNKIFPRSQATSEGMRIFMRHLF